MRIKKQLWTTVLLSSMFFCHCADTSRCESLDSEDPLLGEQSPYTESESCADSDVERDNIPDTCNGAKELCARRFDEVAFPATHNAMSSEEFGFSLPNQKFGIPQQLKDGVRAFLIDVHPYPDEDDVEHLMLCHSICLIGSRPFADMLQDLHDFMMQNRGEIVTLIIEDYATAEEISQALIDAGLDKWTYAYDGGEWPTLRTLIDANTRLIVTAERDGHAPGETQENVPPWYFNAWKIMFDNPYTYEKVEEFSCADNRGSQHLPLFLLNHWLGTPFPTRELAEQANAYDTLMAHAQDCTEEKGRIPNFVAVDHYDIGALFRVVNELNGLGE